MSGSTVFSNRVILVLLPVCAFSGRVIKNKNIKASILSMEGIPLNSIHLTMKENGYLVFSSIRPPEENEVRVLLEVPDYLSGSCSLSLNSPDTSLKVQRICLYPTRSIFLGQKYTAICGTAPVGCRILAWSTGIDPAFRLMSDIKEGLSELSVFSSSESAEGRIFAITDHSGKLQTLLETEELISYPNKYRLKEPASSDYRRLETKLYSAAITQPSPGGSYFLPVEVQTDVPMKYTLLIERNFGAGNHVGKEQNYELHEIEILPGKENRMDL